MGVTVQWFDESQKIILMTVTDPWTWEDNQKATDESFAMIDSVPGDCIIHYIIDVRNASSIPENVLSGMKYMAFYRHPREGNKYQVGVKTYLKRFRYAFQFIYPNAAKDYYFVNSIEEAVNKIQAL